MYGKSQAEVKSIVLQFYGKTLRRQVSEQDFTYRPLYSLTNDVYKICNKANSDKIVVKIYQATLPQFSDKHLETKLVSELSKKQIYPQLLFAHNRFRVQKYIESTELKRENVSEAQILEIVKQMAEYSCNFRAFVSDYNEEETVKQKFEIEALRGVFARVYEEKRKECPELVQQCQTSIDQVFGNELVMRTLSRILGELQRVLSHNDCHMGNILMTPLKTYLLDFEFSQFNYIGFDLGNFLNEWATQYSPTFDIREDLELGEEVKEKVIELYYSILMREYSFQPNIKEWRYYTQIGRVVSHLFWMIIGLKQINDPRIEFSMVDYVVKRQQQFLKQFEVLIGMKV